jgi:hypothetical protein
MTEEKPKATVIEEKKDIAKLPKDEQFPWALLTGAYMLFATGLLTIMQGLENKDVTTQSVMFVAAIVVFMLGGSFLHSYHRWLIRQINQ